MRARITDVKGPESMATALAGAAQVILSGGIVAVPTETFYGLAVNALHEKAIERLLAVKRIRTSHPILILLPSADSLSEYVSEIPPIASVLMARFWPGGLTLVMEASPKISPLLTGETGKIGVRLSSHPVATGLALAVGAPITGTSANRTGEAPCRSSEEVVRSLGKDLDLIMDGGATQGGKGSTVLDVTCEPPSILREGIIGRDLLREVLVTI